MSSATPGTVFDCNVFLQALLNDRGPAYGCMELVDSGQVTLLASPEVLAEIKDVLNRPKLQQKFLALTPERVAAFLQDIEGKAVLYTSVPKVITLERGPKDEPYLNLAVTAGARYLVTRDKDLLDLMRMENPEGKDLRQRFPQLTILEPGAFLKEFSSKS